MRDYLLECLQLLYWVFFKPTALRAHINQIAPGYETRLLNAERPRLGRVSANLRELRENPALRKFAFKSLLVGIVVSCLLYGAIGLPIAAFDNHLIWQKGWKIVAVAHAATITTGVAVGVGVSVPLSIVFSLAVGVSVGIVTCITVASVYIGAITAGFAAAVIMAGLGLMTVGGAMETAKISLAVSTTFLLLFTAMSFVRPIPLTDAFIGGSVLFVGLLVLFSVGFTRLPVYLFEVAPAILGYRRATRNNQFERELLRSPVYFDEHIVLPQPYLSSLLFHLLQHDLKAGLAHASFIANHPCQGWAAQKAMKKLLAEGSISFFFMLDYLLTIPEPYKPLSWEWRDIRNSSFRYYSPLSIFGEIADIYWPDFWWNRWEWKITLRLGLRIRKQSRYARFALVYFDLLWTYWRKGENFLEKEEKDVAKIIESYQLDNVVEQLEDARSLPHGEEFFQSLRLLAAFFHCEGLQHVARLRDEFKPLFEIDNPLRPRFTTIFRRLRDTTIDAASFLTAAHAITRRDALLKAGGALEEARQLADEVYEPERSLLLAAIEHWRRMFAVEGGRVAAQVEVEELPNPYVAGRPIRPEDGPLFAGRQAEFRQIEEKLRTGVGVVVYGQRRIGKTSILLHLHERLPHDLRPVYLNLQLLMANTTGGFLRAVAGEVVKQLHPQSAAQISQPSDFDREPYLSFNQLLDEVERQLPPRQRVLLSFDEFEQLEKSVKDGQVEARIFDYMRGITQTGRRFAMLFAGLHTLEQMTREYWNPFFQSVQTIRIGYLGELDARQLITDPIDQFPLAYDEEAIDRITEVTNAHPYLAQSVCHNLVNRLNDPLHRSNKQWRATAADVDAVLERTLESSGYYFDDYVWGWSNADERLALALVAEAGEEAEFAAVEKHLGREAALGATGSLVARDILVERSEGVRLLFRFQIPLSRMWVQRTKSSTRILLERGID